MTRCSWRCCMIFIQKGNRCFHHDPKRGTFRRNAAEIAFCKVAAFPAGYVCSKSLLMVCLAPSRGYSEALQALVVALSIEPRGYLAGSLENIFRQVDWNLGFWKTFVAVFAPRRPLSWIVAHGPTFAIYLSPCQVLQCRSYPADRQGICPPSSIE